MKKLWIYLFGILTGAIITIVVLAIIGNVRNSNEGEVTESEDYNGVTFFDTPGDIIDEPSFKVFQALGNDAALANGKSDGNTSLYLGLTVLLYNEEGVPYYDDQIIKRPKGKCFRQVGIYRYPTRAGIDKTVPIVMIMDR